MKDKVLKPQIRFKGFVETWEQRKLKDMSTYKNGTGHEDKQLSTGKYELINLNSVSIDGGLKPSGKYIDEIDETLQIDDLVMVLSDVGRGNLLGRVAIIPENNRFVLNQRVALLRPNDSVFPRFLFTCINAGQAYFKTNGAGSSQLNISKDVVENFETFVPKKEEQIKISKLFEDIDNLITLHQCNYEKLVETKRALLEKMFPQKGKNTPEIRFKGFNDTWKQRKVSDLFKITRGYVLATTEISQSSSDDKPYPVYSSQTKEKGLMGYYSECLYENAITWTTDGANAGTVNYREGKFYCTNVCGVLLSDKVKANQMLSEAINNVSKGYVSYVGNPKLMNNVMADIEIQLPDNETEREKISEIFKTIDKLISLRQRKIEKLKNIKKSLLNKMFI